MCFEFFNINNFFGLGIFFIKKLIFFLVGIIWLVLFCVIKVGILICLKIGFVKVIIFLNCSVEV